jgi:hypothetical protein
MKCSGRFSESSIDRKRKWVGITKFKIKGDKWDKWIINSIKSEGNKEYGEDVKKN